MLANVVGLERFLSYTGILLKDFGNYVQEVSRQVRAESLAVAESAGRPVEHLTSPSMCKEDVARAIARRDGINPSLIPSRLAMARATSSLHIEGLVKCSTGRPADSATASDSARTCRLTSCT